MACILCPVLLVAITIHGCHGFSVPALSSDSSMWHILDTQPPTQAWKTIFGEMGERGEYMDGYSEKAMYQRCEEDYQWEKEIFGDFASERSAMMSHLYDNAKLWDFVNMVAFAEHYVLDGNQNQNQRLSFDTFQRQKAETSLNEKQPIFSGVVLRNWESCELNILHEEKLASFQSKNIDYVRLECNLGTIDDIGDPKQLVDDKMIRSRFCCLASVAKACQTQQMIPVILLQVPWRDGGAEVSIDYFDKAVHALSTCLKKEGVEPKKLLFETRPPMGISALDEENLTGTERIELGLSIGRTMFEIIDTNFCSVIGDIPAGFCVAGGSTKGDNPTAMQDDTQNAVRKGMRKIARTRYGYDFCFWEMGAKLMLQPKVGQLWGMGRTNDDNNDYDYGTTTSSKDAARDLFFLNAQGMADEIKAELQII